MRIRYTRRAFRDREAIYDYLDERSPKGAINVQRAILHAIRALEAFPRLGQLTEVADVYQLTVPRYTYKVYYRIEGDPSPSFAGSGPVVTSRIRRCGRWRRRSRG